MDQPHASSFPQKVFFEAFPDVGKVHCVCINGNHLGGNKLQQGGELRQQFLISVTNFQEYGLQVPHLAGGMHAGDRH